MTSDKYDSDGAMNWSPPLKLQTVKHREKAESASGKSRACTAIPGRASGSRPSVPLTFETSSPDTNCGRGGANGDGDGAEGECHKTKLLPPRKEPILPPPVPTSIQTTSVSLREYSVLRSIRAPDRRHSKNRPGLSTLNGSTKGYPDKIISLPSLHSLQSPPLSCAATSLDSDSGNSRVLPPIRSALDGLSPNEFAHPGLPPLYSYPRLASSRNDSPQIRHLPQFLPQQIPPGPFSYLSLVSTKNASSSPFTASTAPLLHGPPPPPPSGPVHVATPYSMSFMFAQNSTKGYPTTTEQVRSGPKSGERASFSSLLPANGVLATDSYKCTHPGCTVAPFQTQYLLNSHAKVHSEDRPHFCSVEGCPRGVGGKGFKRKNEMMRHGLVHNSSGFVCPFCPYQQRKYPRPDNLHRHVRASHVDRNKDDPILRQVFAQRLAGSSRGRRRRMNSV